MLDSSTRFLRIMKLASAELGGYELRDDSVYVTDNFFSMLGLAQEQPDPLTPKAFRALMGTLEQRWFYRLSPANNKVFAIPQLVTALFIPLGGLQAFGGTADTVVILYLLAIPSLAIIFGGAASGSPFAGVGVSLKSLSLKIYPF